MSASFIENACPSSVIHLSKSDKGIGLYLVWAKEGNTFPGFLAHPTYYAYSRTREYLLLGLELSDKEDEAEYVIHAVDPAEGSNAPIITVDNLQKESRITSFTFTPEGRAYGTYGNDAILIEASRDLYYLTLRFYPDAASYAPRLLDMWNQRRLQCRVA